MSRTTRTLRSPASRGIGRGWLGRCVAGVVTVLAGLHALPSAGQLLPQRVYYGIDRPALVTAERPANAEGEMTVRVLAAGTGAEIERAACTEGTVDLAELFGSFWEPTSAEKVRYAQLFVGDAPVGPALVLQPMLTPDLASLSSRGEVEWRGGQRVFSGYRIYVDKLAVFRTDRGDVTFRMRPDEAPNTVWNFLSLADGGFYTDVIFHRIIGGGGGVPPFVVQVGDPIGVGSGGPGYFIDLERSSLPHTFGVLSMARASYDPNTNGSQVFICLSRERTRPLDGDYTSFGEAISGTEAILALERVATGPGDRPTDPPVLLTVDLVDAPPYGTGPKPLTRPADNTDRGR